jgi:glutamyl-tRNA synthetase
MKSNSNIRVRFAPSPTGFLHIGGARTAIFNWLYARHTGGTFVLRIEDTDQVRSEERFTNEILESLSWLGLDWDEEMVHQSDRFDLYRKHASRLMEQGLAYESDGAIIFKLPSEVVKVKDLVYGELEFDNSLLNELVIIKSDGTPTYNFACVIDDAAQKISCIIRGDDHISNTPKQIPLYHALGFELPDFAHVPMILGSDGKRLSKRHGATAVLQYREAGFLPEALMNFLVLLGWSPGNDQELIHKEELIQLFSLEGINRKSAIFNLEKLEWMNGQYIRQSSPERLKKELIPILKEKFSKEPSEKLLEGVLRLFRDRFRTLADFPKETAYFFEDTIERDPEALEKYLSNFEARKRLDLLKEKLDQLDDFSAVQLEQVIRNLAASLGIKAGDLIHPARVALTGKSVSPGIFEVMNLLGKDVVLKRLEEVIKR